MALLKDLARRDTGQKIVQNTKNAGYELGSLKLKSLHKKYLIYFLSSINYNNKLSFIN